MADAVKEITHWRRGRDVRHEHTHTVEKELPPEAVRAMVTMAERIERLERVIGALASAATKDSQ